MLVLGTAEAATPVLPGAVQPGHDRPEPAPPEAAPSYDFRIEAPRRSPVPRDVDLVHFDLKGVRVEGAVTLSPERFTPLYRPLIGKSITLADIFNVADGIERAYRDAGYPLVRAYVPPQRVNDGIFTIKVVEGFISTVTVEGGSATTQALIRRYLDPVLASKPLQLSVIEHGLLLANDLPGVAATGILRASPNIPGASDLIVTVAQPWIAGSVSTNNRGSKFSGIWTVTADAALNSLLTGGDQLETRVTVSPHSLEQIGGQMRYRVPLNDEGLVGTLLGVISHGEPGSTLHAFDVLTDSYAVGGRITIPLIRSRAETLSIDSGFTVQDATVKISHTKLSHDRWRVWDATASYLNRSFAGGSLGISVDLAQGLHVLGATKNNSVELSRVGGSTNFTKISGGLRYARPIWGPLGATVLVQGQYSFDPLIIGEQITFGGEQIGRGYDPGAITGDHGLGESLEFHYDRRLTEKWLNALQPYVFVDHAATWYIQRGNAFDPALKDLDITSVGGGMRFWFPYGITAGLELARTLEAVPGSDSGKKATKLLVDLEWKF